MVEVKKAIPAENASGGAGGSLTAPVASGAPANQTGVAPVVAPAAKSVAQYGGNPTGRRLTVFKFPPDTDEGKKERREADADRKKAARAVAEKMVEPAALPSASAPPVGPEPPSADNRKPVFFGEGPVSDDVPPVPWQPELLTDLISELMDAAEKGRVGSFVGKCEEAGLMPKLIKEIESDAQFPPLAKVMLKRSLPKLAAKWLNKSGISAEFQDELEVVSAMLLIVQHDRKTAGKLDELIEQRKLALAQAQAAVTAPGVRKAA